VAIPAGKLIYTLPNAFENVILALWHPRSSACLFEYLDIVAMLTSQVTLFGNNLAMQSYCQDASG
jgi:hypothetical protein